MIEVVLVPAPMPNRDGSVSYFVEIKGVPYAGGKKAVGTLVVSHALPADLAKKAKEAVEDALSAYRKPKRGGKKKPKTAWERILRGSMD